MKTLPDDLMAVSVGWKDHIDGEKSLPSGPSKEALTDNRSTIGAWRRVPPSIAPVVEATNRIFVRMGEGSLNRV
ncbi:hypothetical protein E4T56_gene14258 [Termitomyces sp. T112]|nr:hypothetical protein E4T56_gene14258 [Termitomyces sp. T112]